MALVKRTWRGPFVGELPGGGTVNPGDQIEVPAHQAEDNGHLQPLSKISKEAQTPDVAPDGGGA